MLGVLRAGAEGYVRKDAEPETLLAAVRAVAKGKTYIDPAIGRQLLAAPPPAIADLARDRRAASARARPIEQGNRRGARGGEETVKTHVGHVLSKLQVENRAQAIVQALKRGLVSLDELQ